MSSKLSGTSYLPQDEFIARLKQDFPQVFSEGKIDPVKLQANLKNTVDFDERYGLSWKGKSNVFNVIQSPTTSTLHPQREESVNFDTTDNLFIEGDNLEVLKILQRSYYGKIKMIYIDPPYNTGNDFVYNDHFQEDKAEYEAESGKRDEAGNLTSQSALQKNSKDGGHYHSNWLNMMYPRLYLARNLLRDDGVIFVSIDDNEVHNLRLIMNEIFGEENFISQLAVQLNPRGRHLDKFVAKTHEYVIIFGKNSENSQTIYGVDKDGEMLGEYDKEDSNGKYRLLGLRNRNQSFNPSTRKNLYYPLYVNESANTVAITESDDHTTEVWPITSDGVKTCWTWSKDKVNNENSLITAEKLGEGWRIFRKDYLLDDDGNVATTLLKSLLIDKEINNDYGKKSIKDLFESSVMDFPKSPALIKKFIKISSINNDIILDFFAGSGTTAHAVIDLNTEDGGNRKWICVQIDEKTDEDSEAYKAGYKTISQIARERIRLAGKKINKGDLGFKALKIGETNMKIWDSTITDPKDLNTQLSLVQNPVKDGVDDESLLLELMVKIGVQATTKYEKKGEYYQVGDSLIVCLTSTMTEAIWALILKAKPQKMIVLDSSFAGNDQLKTNLILKAEKEKIEIVVV